MDRFQLAGGTAGQIDFGHVASEFAKDTFFCLQSAGRYRCGPEYYTIRKDYQSYLLLYVIKGKGYLRYDGRYYDLNPGDAMLIDCIPYQEYYSDTNNPWEFLYVHFTGFAAQNYFKLIYENNGAVIQIADQSKMEETFYTLLKDMRENGRLLEARSSCHITNLLTELLLSNQNEKNFGGGYIEQALRFIHEHYSEKLTVAKVAAALPLDPYYFSHLFKKSTGFSPYEYLVKYRISQSRRLLKQTELPTEQIALKCGFDSPSNFIQSFQKHTGMTPHKFRSSAF